MASSRNRCGQISVAHTSVNDLQFIFEEFKPFDHERDNAAQDRLWHADPIKFIQATSIHVLHAIVDTGFYEERAVEFDYQWVDGTV
jgi:hypothetical protein